MAAGATLEREVFLDTAYAIALASPRDEFHQLAVELARRLKLHQTRLITTRAVLLEIGNALSRLQHRPSGIRLLASIEADPAIGIVPLTEPLYQQALVLYRGRADKEWGMTDCVSFVVMQQRRLMSVLTTDSHFEQAGFRILLR